MIWLFWTMAVIFGIITAAGTFKFFDHIFIISTSLLGAYLLMRGIGCYAGHYYSLGVIESMFDENMIG